ncbi:MAG: DUF6390 family protein [Nanoarchaeota archaeon]
MDGLNLAIRFSYITNRLHYCGPKDSQDVFLRYLEKKDNADNVRSSLKRFEGLWPYLTVIAEKHGLDPFDQRVVEAYWIGNELLDACTNEDNCEVIRRLMKRGLPKSIGEEKIKKMSDGLVPHHVFNVVFVGVGNTTGSVPVTLQNMNNCRPSWGKVVDVQESQVVVASQQIVVKEKKYVLEPDTKTAVFLPEMLTPKKGDVVALHWGFACMVLSPGQVQNLELYTSKILKSIVP